MPQLTPDDIKAITNTVTSNVDALKTVSTTISKTVTEWFDKYISGIPQFIKDAFNTDKADVWQSMLQSYVQAGLITGKDRDNLASMFAKLPEYRWILYFLITFNMISAYFQAYIDPSVAKAMQGGLKAIRPALPGVAELVNAAFIAPEKITALREKLARLGYSDEDMDILFLSRYRLYDEDSVRALYLRGILSEEKMFERMRELGYTDTRIQELVRNWTLIPPVMDILTMVGHEAFEPDSIRKMGLDAEFPEEQAEWLSKQGLSPYWQMKYWISHWQQPSIQMGYEMLQRGIIDRETLEFLFRTVEIPAFWRDKLLAIAYTPYTRVDARRMAALGVLNHDELVRAFKDIGYDQEHAEKMAEFTRRANLGAEKNLTKGEIITGYKDRVINKADAKEMLVRLRYDENEAEYILGLADYQELKALGQLYIDAIKARYIDSLIDRPEARRQLDELNLPNVQVDALLGKWDVQRRSDFKMPSKTDLDKFLVYGIISVDIYRREMRKLGYNTEQIGWYELLTKTRGGLTTNE